MRIFLKILIKSNTLKVHINMWFKIGNTLIENHKNFLKQKNPDDFLNMLNGKTVELPYEVLIDDEFMGRYHSIFSKPEYFNLYENFLVYYNDVFDGHHLKWLDLEVPLNSISNLKGLISKRENRYQKLVIETYFIFLDELINQHKNNIVNSVGKTKRIQLFQMTISKIQTVQILLKSFFESFERANPNTVRTKPPVSEEQIIKDKIAEVLIKSRTKNLKDRQEILTEENYEYLLHHLHQFFLGIDSKPPKKITIDLTGELIKYLFYRVKLKVQPNSQASNKEYVWFIKSLISDLDNTEFQTIYSKFNYSKFDKSKLIRYYGYAW